jgi:FkbM family methyltransferase
MSLQWCDSKPREVDYFGRTMNSALFLPDVCREQTRSTSLLYGAGKAASLYCGLDFEQFEMKGHWSHAWGSRHGLIDPIYASGVSDPYSTEILWMGTEVEAEYLRGAGINAKGIGLPIVYLPERTYRRRMGSILVMPVHSLDYTRHRWQTNTFVQEAVKLRARFDDVVVCVHPSCIKNGYWVNEFRAAGFCVVEGAHDSDVNALERVRALMSQFEYVTTNGYGSHIAYAAAFGAKISVIEPYATFHADDYRFCPFYQDHPGLAEQVVEIFSRRGLEQHYSFLFTDPAVAELQTEWGRLQIGADLQLSAEELRDCFGWNTRWSTRHTIKRIVRKVIPKPIRAWVHDVRTRHPEPNAKWIVLETNPELSEINIDGRHFYLASGETFRGTYKSIFECHFYRIPVIHRNPTILDCGANIGLATRYWLERFPEAKIHAFEPDPRLFEILKRNVKEVSTENVTLHRKAVWHRNTTLTFQSTGVETGAITDVTAIEDANSIQVEAIDIAEFLDERIDFLKMDIEGAECQVIPALDGKLDNVLAMYIEYHSYDGQKQRLGDIISTLEDNGFRHAINTNFASKQPMRKTESSYGMDMRLDIWAWKT